MHEITPLDTPPESRPRAPEQPCSGCGLLIDPLRAPVAIAYEDGYRFLCGVDCEQAYRAGTRRAPTQSGRAPKAPRVSAPAPLAESAASPDERVRGSALDPAAHRVWFALGAAALALVLGAIPQVAFATWAADACSCLAAGLALWALGPLVRQEGWLTWSLGPAGVLLAVIATRIAVARGLAVGAVAEQGAVAALLVVARVWLAQRATRPIDALRDRVLAAARTPASLPERADALLASLAQAEHARRRIRALHFGEGSDRDSGRPAAIAAAFSRWGSLVALGLAVVVFAVVPGGVHVRCSAAAVVLLAAPLLASRALGNVLRAAGTLAASRGIFYRGEASLDAIGRCKTVVMSPRGLLTERQPVVVELRQLDRTIAADALMGMAAAAEHAAADHPLARAIQRFARDRRAHEPEVRRPVHLRHQGVTCISSQGQPIVIGSRRLMMEQGISVALAGRHAESESEHSEIFIALDDRVRGVMTLHYDLHEGARPALQHLVDLGLGVLVLTGDQLGAVAALTASLDIEHVKAELLPHERGDEVRALRATGESVAVVGWSGEDDAALLAADAAIAIGTSGPVADSFSVVIADGHLREAAAALWLARALRSQVTRIALSALVPFVVLTVLAATGLLPPALAALTCAPAEVYALGAGARLLRRFALMLPARE